MYPPHVQFDCPTWETTCQLAMFREVPSVDMPHFVGFHLRDLIRIINIIDSLSNILFFFLGKKERNAIFGRKTLDRLKFAKGTTNKEVFCCWLGLPNYMITDLSIGIDC